MKTKASKKVATFLAIAFALSSIFYALIISSGSINAASGLYTLGLMWSPGVAGMITQLIYEHSLRGMGWKPGKVKYLLIALAAPLAYCAVVYGLTWLTGLGKLDPTMMSQIQARWGGLTSSPFLQVVLSVLVSGLVMVPIGLISGLGEEIGWRGLLVPEMMKLTSFNRTALITGAIWTLYHLPLIFFADYNLPGVPKWYGALMFTAMVMGVSFLFVWLRVQSGSLWPPAVLHSSHNVFVQTVFTPLTAMTAVTPFIIDEFGVGLALMGIVMIVILWQRKAPVALGQPETA